MRKTMTQGKKEDKDKEENEVDDQEDNEDNDKEEREDDDTVACLFVCCFYFFVVLFLFCFVLFFCCFAVVFGWCFRIQPYRIVQFMYLHTEHIND